MATSTILRGTMLLTAATFLSKLLGMLYVIPFNHLVGETGGALFYYAYNPYNILLSISTIGVPLAVSKFVSKYNSLGDYETGRRMFKSGMLIMLITGFVAFLLLYLSADLMAKLILARADNPKGNSAEDIAMVIRMVSFALIIVPAMSIVRGFFQGYQSMGPTAISQVVEQIVRIIFLLSAAFVIVNVFNGSISTAVGYATFAAFVGAVASCIVLFLYWRRRKTYLDRQLQQQTHTHDIPTRDLFKELFQYAGPFVLVGIATPLYQQVDVFTFNNAMDAIGLKDISEFALGSVNFYSHKLVIIPVTIATGLSLAMLPAITKSFTEGKKSQMFYQMNQSFQIVMLFVLPAVVGLSLLSNEAYGALFDLNRIDLTSNLLAWYAPVGLFYGLFAVSSSVLQGINQQKFAVVSLSAGLLIKIILNVPLIHLFEAKGAIFGTFLAVFTAVLLNIWRIIVSVEFPMRELIKRTMLIVIFTTIMAISVLLTKWGLSPFLFYRDGQMEALVVLIISITVGAGIYLWLSYSSTLLERVLGSRVRVLDKFLRRTR
ncbi:polysaccharide biosynthesis protein [Aquibacillus koreensis]|uniref:Polysaccharide biosynthesis protein n=1 Tax=Aquibacillus koreensis TaxID=279446 RepID=A0A9X3WL16_9BACI|nr:polysaccharide biosynthesis protein [Aquibacillus koreensis]MCT2535037.1 polysaccharide biosynthesis protein [Aquibacillus koreensis]MDC3419324.1 polysaccharide biosynthesis protein [Aquibacillus koreensis]